MIEQLKKIRKEKHITQKELADALSVDTSVISKYENGKISPSYDRLKAIASVLGVGPDLINRTESNQMLVEHYRRDNSSTDLDKYYISTSTLAEDILAQAHGVCELCGYVVPVERYGAEYEKWFLESHYIEWLSRGGHNEPENIIALCPNCHKRIHELSYEEGVELLKKCNLTRNID